MDGVGGTFKHRVFHDVKSAKRSIKNTEHFAVYAGSILNGITSLYMPVEEVLEEPENINSSQRIPGTLEVHKIARTFSTDGICKMGFYYTVVDEKPFHEQWYKSDGDPDVCGHAELPLSYSPDLTCAECHGTYAADQERWECNLCGQWFHEERFLTEEFIL